jgi:hypothetical protein
MNDIACDIAFRGIFLGKSDRTTLFPVSILIRILDKEATSFDDLYDAFRLRCLFWH